MLEAYMNVILYILGIGFRYPDVSRRVGRGGSVLFWGANFIHFLVLVKRSVQNILKSYIYNDPPPEGRLLRFNLLNRRIVFAHF